MTTNKQIFKKSKATLNYFVDIIAFLPFLLLLTTGIVMLMYHTGKPYSVETIGINGYTWLIIHKTLTVIAIPIVILHLILHYDWLKKLFTLNLNNKYKGINITLFIFLLLCVLTSLFSWFIFTDTNIIKALRGIHNKLGIVLIIFFVIHIIIYFKWIVNMTKQTFKK